MPADDQGPGLGEVPEGSTDRAEEFRIGAKVDASDGECGALARVVVDPVAQALTHLVVAPKHHRGLGRLVPVELVEAVEGDQIRLRCTTAHVDELDDAEDVQFLPANTGLLGYGSHALMWPHYGLGMPPGGGGGRRGARVPRPGGGGGGGGGAGGGGGRRRSRCRPRGWRSGRWGCPAGTRCTPAMAGSVRFRVWLSTPRTIT